LEDGWDDSQTGFMITYVPSKFIGVGGITVSTKQEKITFLVAHTSASSTKDKLVPSPGIHLGQSVI